MPVSVLSILMATLVLQPPRSAFTAGDNLAVRDWTGAGGNQWWSTPANWSPAGPPQSGDWLQFPANNSVAFYDIGTLTLDRIYSGSSPNGVTLHQLQGQLAVNIFAIGISATSATYRFGGASARLTTGETYIGANGIGTMDVGGGTWAAGNFLSIGDAPNARGRVTISGSAVVSSPEWNVGYYGDGTLQMSGGSMLVGSFMSVGHIAGGRGTVEFLSGSLLSPIGVVGLTGSGTFLQSGGSVTFLQWCDLGEDAGSSGTMRVSGGSFTASEFTVGFLGTGDFGASGGTVTTGTLYVGERGKVSVGGGAVSFGQLSIDPGGTVDVLSHEFATDAEHALLTNYAAGGRLFSTATDGRPGFGTGVVRATLAGDANLDRAVTLDDFSTVASNFNAVGFWPRGDFDYDAMVTLADFSQVAANFNRTFPVRSSNVPDVPGGLACFGGLAVLWGRKRSA